MIPFKPVALLALCLAGLSPASFAGTAVADPATEAVVASAAMSFSIEQLIAEARRNNAALRAARYSLDASRARMAQAGARSNPRLELGASTDAPFGNEGEYGASVGLSQDFSISRRVTRQEAVARIDTDIATADLSDQERQLAGEIAADAWRLVVIDRRVAIRHDLITQIDVLAKATQTRFKAAEVSELDVNAVRLDLQQQQQALRLLEIQRQAIVASLNARLGRPATAPLAITDTVPDALTLPPVEAWIARAEASRSDLRGTALAVDRAQASRALAEAERWEDWTAGVAIKQDKLVVDGAPPQSTSHSLEMNLSIPLPLYSRNRARVAEADADAAAASAKTEALRQAIAVDIGNAWQEASALQGQLAQYRDELLPVSARSVQLAQKGYTDGLASMPEVLQAQRQQADVNGAYLDTLDQFLQALARLRTAAGDDIAGSHETESPGPVK